MYLTVTLLYFLSLPELETLILDVMFDGFKVNVLGSSLSIKSEYTPLL